MLRFLNIYTVVFSQQANRNALSRNCLSVLLILAIILVAGCPPGGQPNRGSSDTLLGTVTKNFFNPNEPVSTMRDGVDELQVIKADSRGRIVLVGTASYVDGCRGEIAVARYEADGSPDNSFGFPNDNTTRVTFSARPMDYSINVIDADIHGDSIVVLARLLFNWCCVCGSGEGGLPLCPCPPDTAVYSTHVVRLNDAGNGEWGTGEWGTVIGEWGTVIGK